VSPGPRRRSAAPPSQRARRADPARQAAFDVLRAVEAEDAYANLVLPRVLRARRLSGRDAAFATELAYGALRGRGLYDAVLARCLDRPLDRLDPPLLDVLRLGVHQLLDMRVPSHAAVSESVGLARSAVGSGAGGLANAVLRRVAELDLAAWVARVAPPADDDPVGHLAVSRSHPPWVVRALRESLVASGGGADELAALLDADNARPAVALAALPGLATVEDLVAAGARPGRWSPVAAVLPAGDPGALDAVRSGRARVQDEGSQLAALALLAADVDGTDERWLDLCAGPGGKAALLAAAGRLRGAELTAVEVAPHRARLLEQALATVPGGWHVRVGDGRELGAEEPGAYDRVLLDAPCSGLGALRRRPEARWRRQPSDLAALTPLQRALLRSALDAVRPGGVVAYVTCSPHPAETFAVVDDVLRRRDDVTREDAPALVCAAAGRDVPDLGGGPTAQLWPHRHGTDAMFVAVLRRH
jgi:16S rRNA (cytosine967-C5)-methyltransferase